uniref:Uncharacterized protein n=1 Tax=Brassica oleracea var. oleracea TaxID=109376 RepID=A0A0D3CGE0_BRAOL
HTDSSWCVISRESSSLSSRFHSSKAYPLYQLRVSTPREVFIIWYQSNTPSLRARFEDKSF